MQAQSWLWLLIVLVAPNPQEHQAYLPKHALVTVLCSRHQYLRADRHEPFGDVPSRDLRSPLRTMLKMCVDRSSGSDVVAFYCGFSIADCGLNSIWR